MGRCDVLDCSVNRLVRGKIDLYTRGRVATFAQGGRDDLTIARISGADENMIAMSDGETFSYGSSKTTVCSGNKCDWSSAHDHLLMYLSGTHDNVGIAAQGLSTVRPESRSVMMRMMSRSEGEC